MENISLNSTIIIYIFNLLIITKITLYLSLVDESYNLDNFIIKSIVNSFYI